MIRIYNKKGIVLDTKNKYCTENIQVAIDDTDLKPENIVENKWVLGVVGTAKTGEIPDGYIIPEGQTNITANGVYDITSYASANVEVPIPEGYIVPEGQKDITANGVHDITSYASVNVNVPIPDGYIIPEGQTNITANGVYDITSSASVNVNVPVPDGYIVPEGNFVISENGDYNIRDKESVTVNVPVPDGYIIPTGNLVISENGNYNIRDKESVTVNVKSSGGEDYLAAAMNDTLTSYRTDQVSTIRSNSFYKNTNLRTLDTTATTIEYYSLYYSSGLTNLVLRGNSVASVSSYDGTFTYSFRNNYNGVGHIFVPDSLVDSYKSATNWSSTSLSNKIYPLSIYDAGLLATLTSMEIVKGTVINYEGSPNIAQLSPNSSCKLHIHVPEGCSSFLIILSPDSYTTLNVYEIDSIETIKATNDSGGGNYKKVRYENVSSGDHFVYLEAVPRSTSGANKITASFRALPMN